MNFKFDDIKKVKEIRIKSKLAKLIPTIKTEDNPNIEYIKKIYQRYSQSNTSCEG